MSPITPSVMSDEVHAPHLSRATVASSRAVAEALIIDAVRTPMGRYRGALAGVRPDDLAARAIAAAVERTGIDPAEVADVYWGAANQAGEDNRDVARMAALLAGLPVEVPGVTVNRLCASGPRGGQPGLAGAAPRRGRPLPRRRLGVDEPRALGDGEARGGARPRRADAARHRARLAADQPEDGGALLDRGDGRDGRERRRALRRSRARTRTRSRCAATSARVAAQARGALRRAAGRGRGAGPKRGETVAVEADEGPRADTSLEQLAALRPAFREGGTVTAGNASTLNDGAACLVLASERKAAELGAEPLARDRRHRRRRRRPRRTWGSGRSRRSARALEAAGLELDEIDLIEINEAFAAQVLACVARARASTRSGSTSTAARSRSATRSAARARGC